MKYTLALSECERHDLSLSFLLPVLRLDLRLLRSGYCIDLRNRAETCLHGTGRSVSSGEASDEPSRQTYQKIVLGLGASGGNSVFSSFFRKICKIRRKIPINVKIMMAPSLMISIRATFVAIFGLRG